MVNLSSTGYFASTSTPMRGGSGQNTFVYSNPEVDMLPTQGAATLEQSQRRPIYQKIQAIIRHDLPVLPIFQNVNIRSNRCNIKDRYWV